jgi:predicted transcriptional regulator
LAAYPKDLSKIERVILIIKKNFPIVWFTAKEVQEVYEKEIGEPISLSAISTYLSRLADKGMLMKTKNANRIVFRLISKELKEIARPF